VSFPSTRMATNRPVVAAGAFRYPKWSRHDRRSRGPKPSWFNGRFLMKTTIRNGLISDATLIQTRSRKPSARCARASASTALPSSWASPTAQCSALLRSCEALSSPREASPLSGRAWDLPAASVKAGARAIDLCHHQVPATPSASRPRCTCGRRA
jgi:hypothetical protein